MRTRVCLYILGVACVIFASIFAYKVNIRNKTHENYFVKYADEVMKCRSSGWSRANPCINVLYDRTTKEISIKQLLRELDESRSKVLFMEHECHGMAHSIGRESYKRTKDIYKALNQCDNTCGQGCVHGVMEGALITDVPRDQLGHLSPSEIKGKLSTFCNEERLKDANFETTFLCYHGLGHIIMYIYQDIPRALEICESFTSEKSRYACRTGIFMENSTGFNAQKTFVGNQNDYLYPCNETKDEYKSSCYAMNVPNMRKKGLKFEQIPQECIKAGVHAPYCFSSLGMELAYQVKAGNMELARHVCEDLSGKNGPYCVLAIAGSSIGAGAYGVDRMYEFCSKLKQKDAQKLCHIMIFDISIHNFEYQADSVYGDCLKKSKREYCDIALSEYDKKKFGGIR